ncbi:BACON domain-containing protein [Marinifilum fragile]|uniref:BACON domain-containing protein n=1 Tax=Marinifilum fragile TaxID=570161 RepID=UPI002AAB77F7|nr:hypothetical protein [Marinifilum fragile]
MNPIKISVFALCLILITLSCEKEKIIEKEVLIEPQLILSADTLVFNNEETKELFLSTKPAAESEYQVVSSPDWVEVNPASGNIESNIKKISITSNFSGMEAGIFSDELIIMSTSGNDTVNLIGLLGEQLLYSIPDSIKFSTFSNSEKLIIKNEGNVSLSYNLSASDSYIELPSETGEVLVGEQKEIIVNVNKESLETGYFLPEIYVNINEVADTVAVKVEVFREQKQILTTDIIDAEYSKATDKLVYVTSNSSVNIYNASTQTTDIISLSYLPTCLSLSLDGTKAVVGHDGHISYVDLQTKEIINIHDVSCNALDIVLGENEWAYVFPKQDQWARIRCIDVNLTNSTETTHTGNSIYAGTKAKLHPNGKSIYGADNGLSPSDLEKYDIQNGTAVYLYDSPYHGDYSISGDLWFSEDGNRIFTRGKNVFKTSETKEQDMLYNGAIQLESNSSYSYSGIIWLDHIEAKKNLYILSSGDDYWDDANKPYVYVYNSDNLTFKSKIELEKYLVSDNSGGGNFYSAEPYFVFSKSTGEEIYVITKAVGSGLANEWAIQIINTDQ